MRPALDLGGGLGRGEARARARVCVLCVQTSDEQESRETALLRLFVVSLLVGLAL